jgi:protein phosphatase
LDGRDIEPEYSVRQVRPGDRYLICSDGLSGVVSAETIAETLREYVDPQQCVERLVQLALRGGGPDNITVVVADATDEDIVESAPIVGGAAARDRGMATSADDSTPAARASAALAAPPRPSVPENGAGGLAVREDSEPPRRHPVRSAVLLVVLLGLLGGGLWVGWRWTQSQYYVGATDDGQLAVFQGLPGHIAGLSLSSVHETSETELDDLTSVAQERVKQGIQADNRVDARRRLAELTSDDPGNPNRKPYCPTTPAADPSGAATTPPAANGTTTPGGTPAGTEPAGSSPAGVATPTEEPEPTMTVDPNDCIEPN